MERYSYTVFGEPNRTSDYDNPYMFTGRRFDTETSNYYYRARYYKPEIGRFLQTDPIGYIAGLNLYTYVLNNPIVLTDPRGLLCCDGLGLSLCLGEKWRWLMQNPQVVGACGIMCAACIASHFTAFWPCLGCGGCLAGAIVNVAECFITNCEW